MGYLQENVFNDATSLQVLQVQDLQGVQAVLLDACVDNSGFKAWAREHKYGEFAFAEKGTKIGTYAVIEKFSMKRTTKDTFHLVLGELGCRLPFILHASSDWPDYLKEGGDVSLNCEPKYTPSTSDKIRCVKVQLSISTDDLAC